MQSIICSAGLALSCRARLSSNVRPHESPPSPGHMSFEIRIAARRTLCEEGGFFMGQLRIGAHTERLACPSHLWSSRQYEVQWRAAVQRLLQSPRASSALVVSVAHGRNLIEWWPMHRRGSQVILCNQLLRFAKPMRRIAPSRAHASCRPPRPSARAALGRISTWSVAVRAIARWASGQKRAA